MPANIMLLCNWHGTGGAQLDAGLLASAFRERGYRSSLGFLFEREPDARHGVDDFFVVAPKAPKLPHEWLAFQKRVRTEIGGRRPDVIIGFQPMANVVGALVARKLGNCRLVGTQRNPSRNQNPVIGYIERLAGASSLYYSNIVISKAVADTFDHYPASYRQKLALVHNGNPPLIDDGADRETLRARFGMRSDGPVLGALGRLHHQKNVGFAIRVLARLPHGDLYLAGEGPEEASLKALARELGLQQRVHFLGTLKGADIAGFYRAIDILMFPSIFEGFGKVLVEAMSVGTPIIANALPVIHEVCADGAVILPLDEDRWRQAVTDLATDAPKREALVELAVKRAKIFDLDSMVTGYLAAAGLPAYAQEAK